MIKADYHLHSSFSSDSETPMESQIEKAIELGLEDICFTEHMDLDYPKEYGEFNFSIEEYFKKIKEILFNALLFLVIFSELAILPVIAGK